MSVSVEYIQSLVAEMNAERDAREAERKALIEDETPWTPCDDDTCLWCN